MVGGGRYCWLRGFGLRLEGRHGVEVAFELFSLRSVHAGDVAPRVSFSQQVDAAGWMRWSCGAMRGHCSWSPWR